MNHEHIHSDLITFEHVSVILERIVKHLGETDPEAQDIILNHFNPERMMAEVLSIFTPKAFANLYQTEFGKGMICGAFTQEFIFVKEEEE